MYPIWITVKTDDSNWMLIFGVILEITPNEICKIKWNLGYGLSGFSGIPDLVWSGVDSVKYGDFGCSHFSDLPYLAGDIWGCAADWWIWPISPSTPVITPGDPWGGGWNGPYNVSWIWLNRGKWQNVHQMCTGFGHFGVVSQFWGCNLVHFLAISWRDLGSFWALFLEGDFGF